MTDLRPEAEMSAPETGQSELQDVISHEPLHERDRIPAFMLNIQSALFGVTTYQGRFRIGVALVLFALAVGLVLSGVRFLANVIEALDILAFVGLFLVNWVGNGGILVPIPGARFVGLLMIFQHAVILPSWGVFLVSGAAMALGLLSYYIAGARAARAYQRGDSKRAEQLASDTGMMASAADGSADTRSLVTGALEGPSMAQQTADDSDGSSRRRRMMRRFSDSWEKAIARARPAIEEHGIWGMFWLCLAPTPLGTAAAFVGGAMGFGFSRYMLSSFGSKFLLAGLIVGLALLFSDQARAIDIDL